MKSCKLGERHISLAETKHILASLYAKREKYPEAITLLKSALFIYNRAKGYETLKSDILDLLGGSFANINGDVNAILSYEQSLTIKQTVLGKNHIACANVLIELGQLKMKTGDLGDALIAFKEGTALAYHSSVCCCSFY